ncbi:MAG: TldD/PmbA family protein, partial [Erysipelotrichia bacterium]|nr:TldD/PmbA family protein [Erysipelotrichia bacterium]
MHKQYSMYLAQIKAKIIELERLLQQKFTYVSILATDVNGISVRVGQKQKSISDYMLSERGFVIRVYQDGLY